jgi:hypothetical protein
MRWGLEDNAAVIDAVEKTAQQTRNDRTKGEQTINESSSGYLRV